MDAFPPPPEVPAEQRVSGECALRYEDVAQDGRLMPLAIPHLLGEVVWAKRLVHHPLHRLGRQGIVPILTAGRVFAEHVFTRPFAPPGAHRVERLELPGLPEVPPERWDMHAWESLLELPPGAAWLDAATVEDAAPVVFGLHHTDSNRHVNSLVYPRLFQDAAARRLAAHGERLDRLPVRVEVAYRKPCFAGDAVRLRLRAFRAGEHPGAAGTFAASASDDARPYAALRVHFGGSPGGPS
jgi:hypothetical protein